MARHSAASPAWDWGGPVESVEPIAAGDVAAFLEVGGLDHRYEGRGLTSAVNRWLRVDVRPRVAQCGPRVRDPRRFKALLFVPVSVGEASPVPQRLWRRTGYFG